MLTAEIVATFAPDIHTHDGFVGLKNLSVFIVDYELIGGFAIAVSGGAVGYLPEGAEFGGELGHCHLFHIFLFSDYITKIQHFL